ncbi:MAG: DUF1501 domain-containing protein [Planctomycetia bacterium]|nr:DUF1501 domain-containing protein [Planctomycetia bacterium]
MNEYSLSTRRAMLRDSAFGLGSFALNSLLAQDRLSGDSRFSLQPRKGHHPAKAKSVIMLFQNGGPSHMDLFDPKPELKRRHGEQVNIKNAMQGNSEPLMGSKFTFKRQGKSGIEFSELVPHLGARADDLCVVRSLFHEDPNHPGGTYMLCSCNRRPGRPTLGSWVVYGLGSENQNLPAFVCLRESSAFHSGGSMQIHNGWLPSMFCGTELRTEGEAVLNLRSPRAIPNGVQENSLGLLARLNERHRRDYPDDTELDARIRNYELACRMQLAAASELDLFAEPTKVQELYGLHDPTTAVYGRKCLMARRLVERGVRFVQVLAPAPHNSWDHHGDINNRLPKLCQQVERPSAALISDLKQRGLLESTIVLWIGEFGRMPISQGGTGRDHNPHGFTALLAGGGFKAGHIHGATDEFGYRAVQDRISVPDLMATVLHQLGLNHEHLSFPNHGILETLTESRITGAKVVKELLA